MKYCLDCGFVGKSKWQTPGTLALEIVLWLFFVVPGVIYSLWRWRASHEECGACGKRHIVPTDSSAAQEAFRRLSPSSSPNVWYCMACGEPIFRAGNRCEKCAAPSPRTSDEPVTLGA